MAKLPMSPDTIYDEVKSSKEILAKWEAKLGQPLPGVDAPGGEEQLVDMLRELCGELMVVANKCQGVAVVLAEHTV